MTVNNICKVFVGSILISMLIGGATRLAGQKFEEHIAEKAEEEKIIYIAEQVPQPKEENEDVIVAFNELDDGEFVRA